MTISATTQGLRPGVCTSSNRPATPFEGQMIYETDTDRVLVHNGTTWQVINYGVRSPMLNIDLLVIGGGGAGG